MKTFPVRFLVSASVLSTAVMLGLPAIQLVTPASAAGVDAVHWTTTGHLVYLPVNRHAGDGAVLGLGDNAPSSQAGSAASVPGAPRITSATPGNGSVTLNWRAPFSGGSGITGYNVRYAPSGTTSWTTVATGSTSRTFTVTGLSVQAYVFAVQAVNSAGPGNWSNSYGPVTPLGAPTVPGAPTVTSVTPGVGSLSVAWSAPSSNGSPISSYTVSTSTDGITYGVGVTVTNTSTTLTGLASGTKYFVEVRATNGVGPGPWSTPGSGTPLASATVPGAPTITGVTPAVNAVSVTWSAPSNGGATISSYSLQYSANGGGWTAVSAKPTSSPYTVTGLASTSSYVFQVAATNSVGTGAWSASSGVVKPLAGSNGIDYHGGPVLVNNVNVYEIWYGNWTGATARQSIVDTFLHGIGGTAYFNTNTSYYDASGTYVKNVVTVAGSATASGSTSLNSNSIAPIVANAISVNHWTADPNAVYFVFTSANVSVSGFLTQFCGFHGNMTVNSVATQYAFVGDPTGGSIANCSGQTGGSPNGDLGGDAMVSVVAHELSEATTDPQLNAWYSSASGNENGDLCAWNFGSVFLASNGSYANVTWTINSKSYQFLIQQNWVNAAGGYCALSY